MQIQTPCPQITTDPQVDVLIVKIILLIVSFGRTEDLIWIICGCLVYSSSQYCCCFECRMECWTTNMMFLMRSGILSFPVTAIKLEFIPYCVQSHVMHRSFRRVQFSAHMLANNLLQEFIKKPHHVSLCTPWLYNSGICVQSLPHICQRNNCLWEQIHESWETL